MEMFGAGTACIVSPIASILYKDQLLQLPTMLHEDKQFAKFQNTLYRIQYGYDQHPWAIIVDDYCQ